MPDFAVHDSSPEVGEEGFRMVAGIDDSVIPPEQFFAGIFRNLTKLVIHVSDVTSRIGDGDDGMSVERGLYVAQLLQCGLNACFRAFAESRFEGFQALDQL